MRFVQGKYIRGKLNGIFITPFNRQRDLTVDILLNAVWPLRQWMVQYVQRSDDVTFLTNMKVMLVAFGEMISVPPNHLTPAIDPKQKIRRKKYGILKNRSKHVDFFLFFSIRQLEASRCVQNDVRGCANIFHY